MNPEQQENNSKRTSDELIPPRREISDSMGSQATIFSTRQELHNVPLVNRNVKRATLYSEEETISRNVLVMSEFRHHQAMPQFLQERMPSDQNRGVGYIDLKYVFKEWLLNSSFIVLKYPQEDQLASDGQSRQNWSANIERIPRTEI